MKIIILLIATLFINKTLLSSPLFESDFHILNFKSNNIENDKINRISQIKYSNFLSILKKILIEEDFKKLKNIVDEDLINIFIKNIIIEDEKIINDNYFAKIKVNFSKKKIINYLRKKGTPYVEFLPEDILLIFYEKNKINRNFLSKKNQHYNYLLKNEDQYPFYKIPLLDINDRFLLNYKDIENKDIKKIKKFTEKYSKSNSVIIISTEENNLINYSILYFSNNRIIEINEDQFKKNDMGNFFKINKKQILNHWKKENLIQNKIINKINCNIEYFNIEELREIKLYLDQISTIKNYILTNIAYKKNNYDIFFYGNESILFKLFNINEINISKNNNICNIYLK